MPKILIVEDNPQIMDIINRRLTRKGYDTITAEDGVIAVQLANAERPDLILMDMSLPKKDGWQATYEIRGIPEIENTPIIALTAHAMSVHREKALEAGCNEYQSKPIDFKQLIPKIEALLQGS